MKNKEETKVPLSTNVQEIGNMVDTYFMNQGITDRPFGVFVFDMTLRRTGFASNLSEHDVIVLISQWLEGEKKRLQVN